MEGFTVVGFCFVAVCVSFAVLTCERVYCCGVLFCFVVVLVFSVVWVSFTERFSVVVFVLRWFVSRLLC